MKTSEVVADRPLEAKEVDVIGMTTGLGCDSVPVTAASQPSIKDVLMGAMPVLAYGMGDEFMHFWYEAGAGRLQPRPERTLSGSTSVADSGGRKR